MSQHFRNLASLKAIEKQRQKYFCSSLAGRVLLLLLAVPIHGALQSFEKAYRRMIAECISDRGDVGIGMLDVTLAWRAVLGRIFVPG